MTVKGLDRLRRKLASLPDVAKEDIAKSLEKGAEQIVSLAQSLVPIDDMTLYDSIGWTWGEAPKGSLTLASATRRRGSDTLRITVYAGNSEAFYARWVEFGTAPHNTASGGGRASAKQNRASGYLGHPGAAASPFFFPAYRANRRRVRRGIATAVNGAAKKVAKGG